MSDSFFRRVLSPVVTFREGEAGTGILMFIYAFLAMAAYNNIKPSAASEFIAALGADNMPWVFLFAGISSGFILNYYSRLVAMVPKLWVLPGTQLGVIAILITFWFLFQSGQEWVAVAFFFFGRQLLGIFLISQFWLLANDIYQPRQAKRLFGFIGAGALLGGASGATLTVLFVDRLGTTNLLLVSSGILAVSFFLVLMIQRRTRPDATDSFKVKTDTVGSGEALSMLRQSRHLQIIALIIGFGALGALTLENQFYMVLEDQVGTKDTITKYIAGMTTVSSFAGFVIQFATPRIYSLFGVGFALAILPVNLVLWSGVVLAKGALWASATARASDTTLRYSIDKTTREVLFLPLSAEIKLKAKGFVDVVADRFIGKGIGSAILLVATKLLGAEWWHLSLIALVYAALWLPVTRLAKREYLSSFRRSIETLSLEPEELTPQAGDLATVETLVEELGSWDEQRVLRSIELLEALEKRNLITPLLLHHASPRVRSRALVAIQGARSELVERWLPSVELSLKDDDPDVRAAAVEVIASVHNSDVRDLMRPYLRDSDPRIVATAAVALAESSDESDRTIVEETLERLASDGRESAVPARREAARAIARTTDPRFRQLLTPLMNDPDVSVAREAIRSARLLGDTDLLFVPVLVSLLRDRRLKNTARDVLVSYGEDVIPTLTYFLNDEQEDPWVRRHIPSTLALIPSESSVAELLGCLGGDDGFIRYKAIKALEHISRESTEDADAGARAALALDPEPIQALLRKEVTRYYRYLGSTYDLFEKGNLSRDTLLAQALEEKRDRAMDRIYRLMGLLYDGSDIRAARWAIEHGDARARSSGIEFLDNTLSGDVRKLLLPVVDEVPLDEKVRKGNVLIKTRVRDVEESLTRLIYDEDEVVAATAIDMVREQKMWSLADDLEQVLAFRDAKDFAVFEAASYALAAHHHETETDAAHAV